MQKRNKVIYWIATLWLSLGMVSTGIVQLLRMEEEVTLLVQSLGYPMYFLIMLGIWKIVGVIAILMPKFPLIKEWAYAGFFFSMSGAIISHIASGSPMSDVYPPVLLLVLTIVSWYFRPANRKIITMNP